MGLSDPLHSLSLSLPRLSLKPERGLPIICTSRNSRLFLFVYFSNGPHGAGVSGPLWRGPIRQLAGNRPSLCFVAASHYLRR